MLTFSPAVEGDRSGRGVYPICVWVPFSTFTSVLISRAGVTRCIPVEQNCALRPRSAPLDGVIHHRLKLEQVAWDRLFKPTLDGEVPG